MPDASTHWRLTGKIESPTGMTPVAGLLVPKLTRTVIDPDTGKTVLHVEPVTNGGVPFLNGTVDLWLPKGQQIALTVIVERGPRLYKLLDPRDADGTVSEVVGTWDADPGVLLTGGAVVSQVELSAAMERIDTAELAARTATADAQQASVLATYAAEQAREAAGLATALVTLGPDAIANKDALNAALNSGMKSIRVLGSGPLNTPVRVSSPCEIIGSGPGATVITTQYRTSPVFDVLDATGPVYISGMSLGSIGPKSMDTTSYRGGARYTQSAAIATNSNNLTVDNVHIDGFVSGVLAINWNSASASRTGLVSDITVRNVVTTGVDFGFLAAGVQRVLVSDLRGTYTQTAGSNNPPHLVYVSESARPDDAARDLTFLDLYAWDSPGGHGIQVKGVSRVRIDRAFFRGCGGAISMANLAGATINDVTAASDAASNYPLYMQPGNSNVALMKITLEPRDPATAIRMDGTNCSLRDCLVTVTSPASAGHNDIMVYGANNELSNVRVEQLGPGYHNAVYLVGGPHVVRGFTGNRVADGIVISATASDGCSIEVDPRRVARATAGNRTVRVARVNTRVTIATTDVAFTTGAGEAVLMRADEMTAARVTITGAKAFTISNPVEPSIGATLEVELTNTSATVSGTITWGSAFRFTHTAVASLAAEATVVVRFRYNGTLWVQS